MLKETHVIELLPAYALGCLDREEEILVSEHLAGCPSCRAELRSFEGVVDQLALTVPEVGPPAALKSRLLDHVQPVRTTPGSVPPVSWLERLTGLLRRTVPAWGLLSLILIVALALNNISLQRQIDKSALDFSGMRVVALSATDAAPGATGTLILSLDGEHGTLVVDGLPPLDETRQYQLWLIKDEQRTDGGLLTVNADGYGALWVSSPEPLSSYPAFGITVEPAGGSPGPTGDKVLGGSL